MNIQIKTKNVKKIIEKSTSFFKENSTDLSTLLKSLQFVS